MSEKLHVDLSGAPQTMLATFYAKALDADLPKPILGDRWAKEIVDRIDYDWSKTSITKANSPAVTTRSAHFDKWARQFLAVHPVAAVVHLGLRAGRPLLPAGSRPRRRVVRRRLSRCRGPAPPALPYPRRSASSRHRSPTRGGWRRFREITRSDGRRGPDHVPHPRRRHRAAAQVVATPRQVSCSSTPSTGWASSRSGQIGWCAVRERRSLGHRRTR